MGKRENRKRENREKRETGHIDNGPCGIEGKLENGGNRMWTMLRTFIEITKKGKAGKLEGQRGKRGNGKYGKREKRETGKMGNGRNGNGKRKKTGTPIMFFARQSAP